LQSLRIVTRFIAHADDAPSWSQSFQAMRILTVNNLTYLTYSSENLEPLPNIQQWVSWTYLTYSLFVWLVLICAERKVRTYLTYILLSGWLLISDNRFDCDSNLLAWFTASANLPQQNYSGRWQHEKEGTTGETSSTKFTSNKWNTSARPAGARLLHMKPVNVSGWNIFNIDPTSQHNHQLSRPTYLGWTLVINHQSSQ
jgi:hypothetical protein